tara:strand:+ start:65 stop:745 length:681 start_codon:yes stop_codon:yes gene_type:complete
MNSINIVTKTPESPAIVDDIDITPDISLSAKTSTEKTSGDSLDFIKTASFFSGMTITKIIAVFIVLAFLGFNIFQYLANVTDKTTSFLDYMTKDIRKVLNYFIGQPAKDVLISSGEGTKAGIDATAKTMISGVDLVENVVKPQKHEEDYNIATKQLEKAVRTRRPKSKTVNDVSDSEIQNSGNKGYCYVGTDREFRTCVNVNNADQCLSGDIFPTHNLCINPSLRE